MRALVTYRHSWPARTAWLKCCFAISADRLTKALSFLLSLAMAKAEAMDRERALVDSDPEELAEGGPADVQRMVATTMAAVLS